MKIKMLELSQDEIERLEGELYILRTSNNSVVTTPNDAIRLINDLIDKFHICRNCLEEIEPCYCARDD